MSDLEKWEFLRTAPVRDARNPRVRELARDLWRACVTSTMDPTRRARRFIQLAHTVARDWIHQVVDSERVGGEDIAGFTRPENSDDAVDALERGVDDCDAKARLFVALCELVGIRAEVMPQWQGDALAHVYARAYVDGSWQPVELTLARALLGDYGADVPKEQNGQWRLT